MKLRVAVWAVVWVLLPVVPAGALSAADCQRWMAELGGETTALPLAGTDREELLRPLDAASRADRAPTLDASIDEVGKFQERAAALARAGRVSPTEGQRLHILSETVRRCLEHVRDHGP